MAASAARQSEIQAPSHGSPGLWRPLCSPPDTGCVSILDLITLQVHTFQSSALRLSRPRFLTSAPSPADTVSFHPLCRAGLRTLLALAGMQHHSTASTQPLRAAGLDVPLVHSHSDSDTSEESESESGRAAAPQRSLRPRGGGDGPQRAPAAAQRDSLSESPRSGGASAGIGDFGMAAAAVLLGASRGDAVGAPHRGGGAGGKEPAHPRHAAGRPDSKHGSTDRCGFGLCLWYMQANADHVHRTYFRRHPLPLPAELASDLAVSMRDSAEARSAETTARPVTPPEPQLPAPPAMHQWRPEEVRFRTDAIERIGPLRRRKRAERTLFGTMRTVSPAGIHTAGC